MGATCPTSPKGFTKWASFGRRTATRTRQPRLAMRRATYRPTKPDPPKIVTMGADADMASTFHAGIASLHSRHASRRGARRQKAQPAGRRARAALTPRRSPATSRRAPAQVAELVDALASGASGRKAVEVRVFSWAPPLPLMAVRDGSKRRKFQGFVECRQNMAKRSTPPDHMRSGVLPPWLVGDTPSPQPSRLKFGPLGGCHEGGGDEGGDEGREAAILSAIEPAG